MNSLQIYKCPAEGCNKTAPSFAKMKEHLDGCRKYIEQKHEYKATFETKGRSARMKRRNRVVKPKEPV